MKFDVLLFSLLAISFLTAATFETAYATIVFPGNEITTEPLPDPPTGLQVEKNTDGTITLSWTAPQDEFLAIADYFIQYRVSGTIDWNNDDRQRGTTTSETIDMLILGESYDIQIATVHNNGLPDEDFVGDQFATVTVTPAAIPDITIIDKAEWAINPLSMTSTSEITIEWTEPANNGSPISTYKIHYGPEGEQPSTIPTTDTEHTLPDMIVGKVYEIHIEAVNDMGSNTSEAEKLFSQPSPVENETYTASPKSIYLTWEIPQLNGGLGIDGYAVFTLNMDTTEIILHNPDQLITDTKYAIKELEELTKYDVLIVSINDINHHAWETYGQ